MNRFAKSLSMAVASCLAVPLTVVMATATPAAADTNPSNYEKLLITKDTGEPIDLAVLPDNRVLHTARNGAVRLTDPATGSTRIVNTIDVYANSEDGLQTVAIDPQFATNKWVYLYYAPRTMTGTAQNGAPYPATTPTGTAPNSLAAGQDVSYWNQWQGYNQLSRFKWNDATNSLDLTTEQVIIKVEVQRGQCCHVAGDMDWDAAGNLYLVTGDNTPAGTPGANGMAPNNNAPGFNPGFDARRGAGNSNDLRGKILRIKVAEDGTYTVPSGNLFAPGTAQTRPEIFAMGLRNPFRMDVDPKTNSVSWADYGPDAGAPIPERGPKGYVEWQSTAIDRPINGGWPFCHGPNANYNEWNFAGTGSPGAFFDCAAGPTNNSTWNTGLKQLPAATAPQLYYGDAAGEQPRDELVNLGSGTGQGPMGGPVYHSEDYPDSPVKFPSYWNDKAFFAEFSQDYVAALTVDWPAGAVSTIEDFLPNAQARLVGRPIWDNVMDMEFGPDGSLWVLEYGDGFFRQNPDAGLYKVNYAVGNKTPQAAFTTDRVSGSSAPLTVSFDAAGTYDPENGALTYEWDFNGDGTFDATGATASYTYTTLGNYSARLRVTDAQGRAGVTSRSISVGNQAPTVTIATPVNGGFFDWGQRVPFTITTNDAEDGPGTGTAAECARVSWTLGLGHAGHAHPELLGTGCTGSWLMPIDAPEHGATENIYGVVVVNYTDTGSNGLPGATGSTTLLLNPKTLQAEHADQLNGVVETADASAGASGKVTSFDAGDSLVFDPVSFSGITGVTTRATGAGTLSLRSGSATATPFATVTVPAGAGWQDVTTTLTGAPAGSGQLFVTSSGGVEVDAFTFIGAGVADVTGPTVVATPTPAQPTGTNGWYSTSPVTVNLAFSDPSGVTNNTRQYRIVTNANQCGTAGATWTNLPGSGNIEVTAQGTSVICYRGNDAAGNTTTGNTTVRIDSIAPTVTLPGVVDGVTHTANYLVPAVADATGSSGSLVVTSMTLDGAAWNVARPINVATLPLGEHTVVVVARDNAGNATTATFTFRVQASFAGLTALVDRYEGTGAIDDGDADALRSLLTSAQAAEGNRSTALLNQFKAQVRRSVDASAVRTLLLRDADALIADGRP